MGTYQKFRGDPENKLFFLLNNFMGGINTEFSDDNSSDVDFESIINFDMDKLGTLNKRGGFGELTAISEIFNKLDVDNELPNIKNRTETEPNPENENDNVVYMKLLRNDNNCFRALSGFSGENAYRKYQEMYGFQDNHFTLLMITTTLSNGVPASSTAWIYQCELPELEYEGGEPTDTETMTITCYKTSLPIEFNWDRNLMNIETIEFYDKIYFTSNNKCLVCFDRTVEITSDVTFASAFTYSGYSEENVITNSAYIPSGLEIRHIGFNLLADDPIHAINTPSDLISTDSIQGLYITTMNNIPLQSLPLGQKFLLNIMYTGTDNGFTVEMKEGENAISFNSIVNSTYSRTGLKVYEITFKDTPNDEVEIKITKTGATLEPYYDYYNVAQIDAEAKPATQLNVGDYGLVEMYNRAVLYKDDTIWFSEINNFKYIPNYNWVSLPIEPTDKITKICYFKKAYIIFTKQKIYKMTGAFGTNEFAISPVNMSLGCHAGNTIVPIEDTLYFTSPRGLYALKSNQFVEGYENVKELDLKVKKLTSDFTKYSEELSNPAIRFNGISERAYAIRYKDKYLLFYNNYNDKGDYAATNNLDTLAYQFDIGSYTTYRFKEKPTFLFTVDNAIETFSTVAQKEEYLSEEPVFNYNYTQVSGKTLIDTTGNHNDATIKGDITINESDGIKLSGISYLSRVQIDKGSYDFSNGVSFNIDFDLGSLAQANEDNVIFALQQAQPTADKFIITQQTASKSFMGGSVYYTINYEFTPDISTNTDIVNYKIYAHFTNITFGPIAKFRLEHSISPVNVGTHTYSTIAIFSSGTSDLYLGGGSFTITRQNSHYYNSEWTFSSTLTVERSNTTYTNTITSKININLDPAIDKYKEIILRQTFDDGLNLSLTLTNGDKTKIVNKPISDVALLLNRRSWKLNLQYDNTGNNIICTTTYPDIDNTEEITDEIIINDASGLLFNADLDRCYIGTSKDTPSTYARRDLQVYKFNISNLNKSLLNYNFKEGTGTEIYDTVNKTKATLYNATWNIKQGLSFHGAGYIEIPELSRNIYFTNGFELEFKGILGGNSQLVRLIDLATGYNNNNASDKNCSINVGVQNNVLEFNTTSKTFRTYKVQTATVDLTSSHIYKIKCLDNGTGYTISITVDDVLKAQTNFEYGGIENITRFSNFVGKSNTTTEGGFNGVIEYIKLKTYASSSLVPIYRTAIYEFDTTSTDFGKPMYVELKTKAINMKYPQHLKKLKHIFVKEIGGYNYGELFFTLYGDGYIVNDPEIYEYSVDELTGTVIQTYREIKDLPIDERISLLGNMRLSYTKLGEGKYQIRKLVIPKKARNFAICTYGESNDYLSIESFGFVCKLGKVKEG